MINFTNLGMHLEFIRIFEAIRRIIFGSTLYCSLFTFAICSNSPSNVCMDIFGFARNISNTVCILSTVVSDTFPSRFDRSALPERNTWLTELPISTNARYQLLSKIIPKTEEISGRCLKSIDWNASNASELTIFFINSNTHTHWVPIIASLVDYILAFINDTNYETEIELYPIKNLS